MEDQQSKEEVLSKTLYILVEYVGLEPEQVAALRLPDLHLAGKNPSLSVSTGGQPKTVELDLEAHRALVGWLVARPDSVGDYLFPGADAGGMEPRDIRQAVKLAEKSGSGLPVKPMQSKSSAPPPPAPAPQGDAPHKMPEGDETMVSPPKPGPGQPFPARPAPAAPPPSNPEGGPPLRGAPPFSPPPPPSRPPEQGGPPRPSAPFPAQPFPPPGGQTGPEQADMPGRKSTDPFPRSAGRSESKPTPKPVDDKKPRIPPKPVRRRGSEPVPVTMPGKEPEQPPIPITKEPEPFSPPEPETQPADEAPPPDSPPTPQPAVEPAPAPARSKSVEPGHKAVDMPPPPPMPSDGVNRPAILSFAVGGGLVVLALCIICVGGASLFSLQEDTRNQILAGLGLETVDAEATQAALIAEEEALAATQAAAAAPSTATATLPPTSTPTLLPATNTPAPTETATPVPPTQPPTDTPIPTDTPVPTATPTSPPPAASPTPAESPTPEVSPTPAMKYNAPALIEPEDGFQFIGGNTIVLRWQPVELAADEQYAVRMVYNFNGQVTYAGTNLKEPEWTVPLSLFGKVDPPENKYEWYVQIERLNEDGSGTAISPESEHRTFTWK